MPSSYVHPRTRKAPSPERRLSRLLLTATVFDTPGQRIGGRSGQRLFGLRKMLHSFSERDQQARPSKAGKEARGNASHAYPLVQGGKEGRMAWLTRGPAGLSLRR